VSGRKNIAVTCHYWATVHTTWKSSANW